jgi:hypothetical protein
LIFRIGADDGTRTCDLCFTKALLYQLSYIGKKEKTAENSADFLSQKWNSARGFSQALPSFSRLI